MAEKDTTKNDVAEREMAERKIAEIDSGESSYSIDKT